MRLRFYACALLLTSTIASAAEAPASLALTECKLGLAASLAELKGMTPFNTERDGDYMADGYENMRFAYKIGTHPFGLTGLELVHVQGDDEEWGPYDTLEIDVSESFDAAKSRLLASKGQSQCSSEDGASPNRNCTIRDSAGGSTLYLREAQGLTFFECDLY